MFVVRFPIADHHAYVFDSFDEAQHAAVTLLTAYNGTTASPLSHAHYAYDSVIELPRPVGAARGWTVGGFVSIDEAVVGANATHALTARATEAVMWTSLGHPRAAPDYVAVRAEFDARRAGGASEDDIKAWYAAEPQVAVAAADAEARRALAELKAEGRAAGLTSKETARLTAAFKTSHGFAYGVDAARAKLAKLKAEVATQAAAPPPNPKAAMQALKEAVHGVVASQGGKKRARTAARC